MLDTVKPNPPMQRARGRVELEFAETGLTHLYQSGCGKALLPRNFGPIPEAVLLNTSGGVTGGDRLSVQVALKHRAKLSVTTQAAERIYKSSAGFAEITNTLELGTGSQLEWLPQETILYEGAKLKRQLNVSMDESAGLLALETVVFGRKAMGETLHDAQVSDQWRIRRAGRLIYADALRAEMPVSEVMARGATFGGNRVLSTLIYVAPDAQSRIAQARSLLAYDGVEAAASAWNGMMVVRFLAPDAHPMRKALFAFLEAFRGRALPRVWSM